MIGTNTLKQRVVGWNIINMVNAYQCTIQIHLKLKLKNYFTVRGLMRKNLRFPFFSNHVQTIAMRHKQICLLRVIKCTCTSVHPWLIICIVEYRTKWGELQRPTIVRYHGQLNCDSDIQHIGAKNVRSELMMWSLNYCVWLSNSISQ